MKQPWGGGGGGGGGGALLSHISHIDMCRPKRVGFLKHFGRKKGYKVCPFCRVWFSRKLGECMNVFIVSVPNE